MSKEFRLGAFLLLGLACFALAVFMIGDRSSMFHSSYDVKTQFDNVAGLEEGAAVRVGGIRKGMVKHIVLPRRPNEKVTIEMDMQTATHDVIKKDSVAAIKSEGLLGDKYVEIAFGSENAENLKNGDTIASLPPLDITNLITKTDKILDTASGAVDNVKSLTANLDQISGKINGGQGTAGALVNDKTVFNQAAKATTALADDAEAMKHNFLLKGFFKNRGYEDTQDLSKFEIARMPAATPVKTFTYDSQKLFADAEKSKLKNGKMLAEAGKFLEQQPFGSVVIAASTGLKGDSQTDKLLTEAQAYVVRDALVKNYKIEDSHIRTIGLGKTGTDEINKVQIFVYAQGTDVVAASAPPAAKH
jgi:phospholipid/cholesterol/gamma-HCH transport system substrate-binding protein